MDKTKPLYSFRPIDMGDRDLIVKWLHQPHVAEFYYGDGLQNTLDNIALSIEGKHHNGRYTFYHWIGFHDMTPFAFLMTSPVEGLYDPDNPYDKWYQTGESMITLDLLIGEEAYLGKGYASKMIVRFIEQHYADMTKILIDPAQNNPKAIHVYEKAGFKKLEIFYPDFDPLTEHCMMMKNL